MKVWYISKYANHPSNGIYGRHFFFSKYLAREEGLDVTLVLSRSNGVMKNPSMSKFKNFSVYEADGVSIVTINGPIINLGFNIKRIFSWIGFELRLLYWSLVQSKERPDVVIVSSLSLVTFLTGVILKKRFKCKLICEVRDIWPLTLIEIKNLSKRNVAVRILSFIEKLGYKYANSIVGTMGNLAEYIEGVNPKYSEKVEYIPTGFDPVYYEKDDSLIKYFKEKFDELPSSNFIAGYAGTLGKANCIEEIIEVAHIMKDKSVSFVLLGDGVLKSELQKKVNELKLKNVHFFGHCNKKYLPYVLQFCDILLNPWLSNETLYKYGLSPNKWIEYMFSARPIIVSVNGYRNIINDANCGEFIEAGNPSLTAERILYYMNLEKEELDKLGQNGKKYLINNLTYQKLAKKYYDIIVN